MERSTLSPFFVVAACHLAGCFAVADLDRFEQEEPATTQRDLVVFLDGFDDYGGERLEIRLLDERRRRIAVAWIDDMPREHSFVMPGAVPAGEHTVDLYVDENLDGTFTTGEPAWRRPLPPSGRLVFTPDESFVAIDDPDSTPTGERLALNLLNMDPHTAGTQAFELIAFEVVTMRTVGYYYRPDIDEPAFSAFVPGIVGEGLLYRIDFFADFNQNGFYDPPSTAGDHSWRHEQTASTAGIDTDFVHNISFVNVAESFPEPE